VSGGVQPATAYAGVVIEGESRVSPATPPELRPVEDFLNTLDERSFEQHGRRHTGGDLLATPADLAALFGVGAGPEELALARDLRGVLRAMVAGEPPADATDLLARLPLTLAPTGALRPVAGGAEGMLAGVLAGVATAAARGSWARLKMCASPDCRWIYYDGSRNAGGRWCSMRSCGNRAKTRAYRRRANST
jgi:hypothetical protein